MKSGQICSPPLQDEIPKGSGETGSFLDAAVSQKLENHVHTDRHLAFVDMYSFWSVVKSHIAVFGPIYVVIMGRR